MKKLSVYSGKAYFYAVSEYGEYGVNLQLANGDIVDMSNFLSLEDATKLADALNRDMEHKWAK